MIFKPELVRAIQQGKKSMTRRPVKPGEKACRYQQGRVYSIKPGRTKPASLQVTIIDDVRREWVGCISIEDARREGFRTTAEFLAYWHQLYGPAATGGVRRMEKERAELEEEGLVESNIEVAALTASIEESRRLRAERLPLPAIPCLVWVIPFVKGDHRDAPRLLRAGAPSDPLCVKCRRGLPRHPTTGEMPRECPSCGTPTPDEQDDDHGYTSRTRNALEGEPEAISVVDQEKLAKRARDGETTGMTAAGHDKIDRLARDAEDLRQRSRAEPVNRNVRRELARAETALARARRLLAEAA